jgi:hypothetical protein
MTNSSASSSPDPSFPFQPWENCRKAIDITRDAHDYAKWRSLPLEYVRECLHEKLGWLGVYTDRFGTAYFCFPVYGSFNCIVAQQLFTQRKKGEKGPKAWYTDGAKGVGKELCIGCMVCAELIIASESPHDINYVAAMTGLWRDPNVCFIATRGAVKREHVATYPWPHHNGTALPQIVLLGQNDSEKGTDGLTANQRWMHNFAGGTPFPHWRWAPPHSRKDFNERAADSITGQQLLEELIALRQTEPFDPPPIEIPLKGASISWYAEQPIRPEDTLLGDRFLCRTSGMFVVAPSGLGKSTLSIQMAILWCCGLPAFGIKPQKALRILIVQSEDDQGDCTEMSKMIEHLGLSAAQKKLVDQNSELVRCNNLCGDAFVKTLSEKLGSARTADKPFDLVILNPYGVYLGADIQDQEAAMHFLNEQINPLLTEFNCGLVAIHHTPKTQYQDTGKFKIWDWQYWGAGCAAMPNWARAILVIKPETEDMKVYRFIAAKRGRRIGWHPDTERFFAHSSIPDVLRWEDATTTQAAQAKTASSKQKSVDLATAFNQVPLVDPELKKAVIAKIRVACNCSIADARDAIDQLIFEHKVNEYWLPNPLPKGGSFKVVIQASS